MTTSEKAALNDIVQVLENLTVGLDAVEGAFDPCELADERPAPTTRT